MRLQAKLALALVPLVSVPVLAFGWLTWSSLGSDLRADAMRAMDAALIVAEQSIEDLVEKAESSLMLLATSAVVEGYAGNEEGGLDPIPRADVRQLFEDYRAVYPEYDEIRLLPSVPVGEDDQAVGSGGSRLPSRLDVGSGRLYFYRAIDPSVQAVDAGAGEAAVTSHLALSVSLDGVFDRLMQAPSAFGGRLLLAAANGRILFDSRAETVGQIVPQAIRSHLRPGKEHEQPIQVTWNGEYRLARCRPVAADLFAVALLPEAALSAQLWSLALKTLGISLLFALLMAGLLLGGLRRLVLQPLEKLRLAARAIGDGQLQPDIAVTKDDEMGLLAADLRDMGERLGQYHEQIEELAFRDQLTGLPNRRLIREFLAERLTSTPRADALLAVLFLDIDNFKQINDNLGHAVGDRLLETFARRLSDLLDPTPVGEPTYLARFGGDELLIVADGLRNAEDAGELARQILAASVEPYALGDANYIVTASIGIALFPLDADDADGLIRCADLAMYRAKAVGRNAYRFFSADLNARASERLLIEHRLRQALDSGHLAMHYQPIVELATGRLAAFEALLRWTDPDLGPVSPVRFIPIAEETGLIQDLGRWVLDTVCAQIAAWRSAGLTTVPVAVNVSAAHLQREALDEPLAQLLERYQLKASDLHLEITESILMDMTVMNTKRLRALGDLGFSIHIDDFGTGYSSINYLRRFEIDCIKIDRSFVANICTRDEDRALATAMIAMGQALSLSIVAEGIEDADQLALLRELGCNLGQGYLFARPSQADEVMPFMADASLLTRAAHLGQAEAG